jgi:hypothetical protein
LLLVAQGFATNYVYPSTDTSKKTTREEGISHVKFSYILTSKDEYTNINTTKKVIAAPENGDNIYNPSVVERTAIEH